MNHGAIGDEKQIEEYTTKYKRLEYGFNIKNHKGGRSVGVDKEKLGQHYHGDEMPQWGQRLGDESNFHGKRMRLLTCFDLYVDARGDEDK